MTESELEDERRAELRRLNNLPEAHIEDPKSLTAYVSLCRAAAVLLAKAGHAQEGGPPYWFNFVMDPRLSTCLDCIKINDEVELKGPKVGLDQYTLERLDPTADINGIFRK